MRRQKRQTSLFVWFGKSKGKSKGKSEDKSKGKNKGKSKSKSRAPSCRHESGVSILNTHDSREPNE